MSVPFRRAVLSAAFAAATAAAQSPPAPAALPYPSMLEGYQRFGDAPALPWKEANDTVGRIGGWRAYAREAQGAPAPAAASAPRDAASAPTAPAQPDPHASHH